MGAMIVEPEPSQRSIPEAAVWEQDKENVRPLRCGRNAATLAKVFSQHRASDPQEGKNLEEERTLRRAGLEAKLEAAGSSVAFARRGADVEADGANYASAVHHLVSLWCEYAHFTAEWFPSDAFEERRVLERATKALAREPRCRDDERHLRLWLRLADLNREPQEIYSYLWTNEIGASHASFYEAWALHLESQQRFGEAAELLQVGLARNAQPAERLRMCRGGLLARVQERLSSETEGIYDGTDAFSVFVEDGAGPVGAVPSADASRPFLNALSEVEASCLHRPFVARGPQAAGLGRGSGILGDSGAASAAQGSLGRRSGECRPLRCFDESLPDATVAVVEGEASHASIFDARSEWLRPPLRDARAQKENTRAPCGQVGHGGPVRPDQRRVGAGNGAAGGMSSSVDSGLRGLSVFVEQEFVDEPRPESSTRPASPQDSGLAALRHVPPIRPASPQAMAAHIAFAEVMQELRSRDVGMSDAEGGMEDVLSPPRLPQQRPPERKAEDIPVRLSPTLQRFPSSGLAALTAPQAQQASGFGCAALADGRPRVRRALCRVASDATEPSTPPSTTQRRLLGSGAAAGGGGAAGDASAVPRRAPGAPVRSGRVRQRAVDGEEEDGSVAATAALVASLKALRLRDEPAAKRPCLHGFDGFGAAGTDAAAGGSSSSGGRGGGGGGSASSQATMDVVRQPKTPPRRKRWGPRRCLFGDRSRPNHESAGRSSSLSAASSGGCSDRRTGRPSTGSGRCEDLFVDAQLSSGRGGPTGLGGGDGFGSGLGVLGGGLGGLGGGLGAAFGGPGTTRLLIFED